MNSPTSDQAALGPSPAYEELERQAQAVTFARITRLMVINSAFLAIFYLLTYFVTSDSRILRIMAVCAGFSISVCLVRARLKEVVLATYWVGVLSVLGMVGVALTVAGLRPLLALTTAVLPILFVGLVLTPRHMLRAIIFSGVGVLAVGWIDSAAAWSRFDILPGSVMSWIVHSLVGLTVLVLLIAVFQKFDQASRTARESEQRLRLLYETSRLFATITPLDELMPVVANHLARILDAAGCFIMLCDPKTGDPLMSAAYGSEQERVRQLRIASDEPSVVRHVFQRHTTVVIDDASASPLISPRIAAALSLRSLLALPLTHLNHVLGAVLIYESRRQRHFTSHERARVQGLVQQVAAEIANTQSLDRERRRAAQMSILYRLTTAVTTSLDPSEVSRSIVEEIGQAAGYELVSLYLLDGQALRLQRAIGYEAVIEELPLSRGSMGRAARTGQPILIPDVRNDSDYAAAVPDVLSNAFAPIRFGDVTLGVLCLETRAPRVLNADDLNLLVAIAAQIAVTLRNAQLFAQAEQRRLGMEALHTIEQAITALDLDRCLATVAASARSLMKKASLGHVFLAEAGGMRLRAASGPFEREVGRWFLPTGRGLVGWVAQHRQAVNAPQVHSDPRYHHTVGMTQSEAAIPLLINDEMIGVLDVQSERVGAFDEYDLALLSMLAAEAAIAIHNARLFDSERHNRQLTEMLLDVARALNSTLDLAQLLKLILDQLRQLIPYDSAMMALLDASGRHYATRASNNIPERAPLETRIFNVEDKPTTQALYETRRPLRIADTQSFPDWQHPEGDESIRSWLGLPLVRNERVIGFLMLNHTQPNFFSDEHERLAQAFSLHATTAIENAQLLKQAQQQAERERLVYNINRKISATIEIQTVMQTAIEELSRAVQASRCLIRLGADPENMPVAYEFNQPGFPPIGIGSLEHLPMLTTALTENRTVVDYESYVLKDTPVHAGLIAPISTRGHTVGVLILHQCDRARRWTPDEIALLEEVSAQLGIAIDNAELYQEATHSLSDLNLLHSIAMDVASATTLPEALERVVRSVHAAMQRAWVSVLLVDSVTADLSIHAVSNRAHWITDGCLKAGQGIAGWVAQTGRSALVPDVQSDPRYIDLSTDGTTRSQLAVPLIADSQVVGVLNLESAQPDAFDETDMQLLATLGGNLAMIINNLRLLDEVRAVNARLQELDRLKSQFLANVSHELRTPLNSIIGFSEVLLDGLAGELVRDQEEFIENIHSSGKHLLTLINDVLDLSKIQAGQMKLACHPLAPRAAIAEAESVIRSLIVKKKQLLRLELEPDLPDVQADAFRLKQILINLLSNAHKFSPDGSGITLAARRINGAVCFSVIDQGGGIKPEDQEHIFQEFVQADNSLSRAQEGTGLGLPITRRLVEMHGGRLWIESEGVPGKGAAFHFTIPVTPAAEVQTPAALPVVSGPTPRRALIIEDDRQYSNLLALYLSQQGYQPFQLHNGHTAVQLARELHPSVITLDLMMPERDGWSVLRDLKGDPETREMPVIIISALDYSELGLSQGALEYLTKPLDMEALRAVLYRIDPKPRPDPQRVLVVDDDPYVGELLAAMLRTPDYLVTSVTNGLDALEAIRRNPPNMLLLDLLMPHLNGYDLLDLLRADPVTHDLPVIVLTAKELNEAEGVRLKAAAQVIMRKTELTRQRLIEVLNRLHLPVQVEVEPMETLR
ncbi:MAG TPA: GAF domain-containing protein [Anaerolineae bacterium]|nr:GAF domain-containing protein [Anaerolineae bacterium]